MMNNVEASIELHYMLEKADFDGGYVHDDSIYDDDEDLHEDLTEWVNDAKPCMAFLATKTT